MQEEWYHPSKRAARRLEIALSTPSGRERVARNLYAAHKVLDWRIKNEGFVLSREDMARHEEIMAKQGRIEDL